MTNAWVPKTLVSKPLVPKALIRYAPLLILAMAWEAASRLHLVSSLALPPLTDVAQAWVELVQSGELVANGLSSLYRAGAGLALAIIVGRMLGRRLPERAIKYGAAALFFLFGVLFLNLGVIGLYLGSVFRELKGRPPFIVEGTTFDDTR